MAYKIPSESDNDVFTWERLGGLLDGLRPSVYIGKLKRWVPTSARESAAATTRQMNSPAEVNTKQAK